MLRDELQTRRVVVAETPVLGRLADRLARLLGPLATDAPYVPEEKALLSRDGGVCPSDGSRLRFDPDSPHEHRCGRCGRTLSGSRHHRAWITRYQLWLSERAVHLALLGALRDPGYAARAARILVAYAARYETYPNEDNVLGPSRLFFSTYLESIWLVQVSLAFAMLDTAETTWLAAADRRAIARMLMASVGVVTSFDEGWSNRQVWHHAAALAAGAALHDRELAAVGGRGLRGLLGAVDDDGMWHEGENYHLFALRGFLLGAECARWVGQDLYDDTPLGAMFAAPLATLLPDLTLPARGDAPFGVSVAQPRFADLWEVGRARTGDPRLDAVLTALYAADLPEGDDRGRAELAEQEENRPAARLRRDGLGWKPLLWMRPDDPVRTAPPRRPALLRARQGVVVLRPDPATVVMVECGGRGAGHGHPDALHLTLARGRLLLGDFGTGSYVSPSLHWYRSALAHNAPGRAGGGQAAVAGVCDGVASVGDWSWARVRIDGLFGPDTRARRSVIVGPAWALDVVDVEAAPDVSVDLPLHPLVGVPPVEPMPAEVAPVSSGDAGHETGYDRLTDVTRVACPAALALDEDGSVTLHLVGRSGEHVLAATAPGPPGADFGEGVPLRFLIRRARGAGRWIHLVTWTPDPVEVHERDGLIEVRHGDRDVIVHETSDGLTIRPSGEPSVRFDARSVRPAPAGPPRTPRVPLCEIPLWPAGAEPFGGGLRVAEWELGEASYRRSERSHADRGAMQAALAVGVQHDALLIRVRVRKSEIVVRPPDAPDPALDNEPAEIHSDGVQAYVGRDRWMGVVALPELERGTLRVRAVTGTAAFPAPVTGSCRRTADGYEVRLRLPTGRPWRSGERLRFTVTVNEMVPGRERRSGQLALAGGGWVWLRGDRESPLEAVEAEIA